VQIKTRLIGWALLFMVAYTTVGALVYVASLVLLHQGHVSDLPWLAAAQKKLHRAGMNPHANNWLGQPDCIREDPDLVYIPATGTCRFDNIEFSTSLTFTGEGRSTGPKPKGTGIAVIGDSHAMGWGVNDHETFSAVLQRLSARPVYNLGVASYGTSREFIRLKKSGVLDKVDTVIVQYCNNDYSENLLFDTASRDALRQRVFGQFTQDTPQQTGHVLRTLKGYWLSLKAPISDLLERVRRKNFQRHYGPLLQIIGEHRDALQGKRIIVFYSNPHGQRYRNYPAGADAQLPAVHFLEPDLDWSDYYRLDGHMTPVGHRKAAAQLFDYLQVSASGPD
jgi:hypothetical protein